jgi:hypothetical protein
LAAKPKLLKILAKLIKMWNFEAGLIHSLCGKNGAKNAEMTCFLVSLASSFAQIGRFS